MVPTQEFLGFTAHSLGFRAILGYTSVEAGQILLNVIYVVIKGDWMHLEESTDQTLSQTIIRSDFAQTDR